MTGNESKTKKIMLNLGCGEKYIPGFIHVDLADYPHIDHKSDIAELLRFKDNSADLIYCCHALEYFDRDEIGEVLREWYRVLKKGGVLRIAVPDFEAIVRVYLKYKDIEHQGILGPIYGRWRIHTPTGEKNLCHKTAYDFKSLKKIVESAGFKNVRRYDWKKTVHKDYDDFSQAYVPHMDKKNGILISLNIEADK